MPGGFTLEVACIWTGTLPASCKFKIWNITYWREWKAYLNLWHADHHAGSKWLAITFADILA